MAFLTSKNRSEGTLSKLAMFFALIFVAVGVVLGAVLERFGNFRPLTTKTRTVPGLVTRLKERIA